VRYTTESRKSEKGPGHDRGVAVEGNSQTLDSIYMDPNGVKRGMREENASE